MMMTNVHIILHLFTSISLHLAILLLLFNNFFSQYRTEICLLFVELQQHDDENRRKSDMEHFFFWSLQIFSTWLIDNQSRKKILSRNVDCDWTSLAPLLFIHYSNSQSELMNTKKKLFSNPPEKKERKKTFLLRLEFTFSISNLSKSRTVFREVKRIRNGKHFPIQ